jgi:MFS transporter, FHS family, glucose/mannose:H+ symporter
MATIENRQLTLLLTANACMFVFGVVLLLMGSLLPSLHVSGVRAGSLGSIPLAGILAATVFIGPVLDKMGAKHALAVALAMVAGSLATVPSLSSYLTLAIAALVYGVGGGILNTATNALVATLSESRRSAALNLLGFSFSLGALTSPLLMSLTKGRFSPASALHLLSAVCAAVLVLVLMQKFPAPAQARTPLRSLLGVLRHPLIWVFGALLFFESGNENCVFVWAGKITQAAAHTSAQRAEVALVTISVALGAGRLVAALIVNRLGSRNTLLLSASIVIAGAVEFFAHPTFAGAIAGFALIGLGLASIYPTTLGWAGDSFPSETGTVFGAIMTVGLVGGVAGPLLGGWTASAATTEVLRIPIIAAAAVAILAIAISKMKAAN